MLYATSDLYMFHRNPRISFEPYKCRCVQYQCMGSKGRVCHNSRTQMGVPQLEVPSIGWMVYFLEHPNLKWMITGGTPMTLDPSHGLSMPWAPCHRSHLLLAFTAGHHSVIFRDLGYGKNVMQNSMILAVIYCKCNINNSNNNNKNSKNDNQQLITINN